MQKLKLFILAIFLLSAGSLLAQPADLIVSYISTYKEFAVAEMQRTGVPASITLAQGIYETTAGTSDLVLASNNHFGIKCKNTWTGESVRHDDDLRQECFRKYSSALDSYKDHSDFLRTGQRYAFLFKIDPIDYRSWAYGLKQAGYATSPKYPMSLIKLIEDYNLNEYTLLALQQPRKEVIGKGVIDADVTITAKVYPEGMFKINDTRVVYAVQGSSLLAIAKQYDVDYVKIFEFNEMKETDLLERSQLIYLQKKNKTGMKNFHVVEKSETLYDIAQAEGIRLENLCELNFCKTTDIPMPGEKLNLKTKASMAPRMLNNGLTNR